MKGTAAVKSPVTRGARARIRSARTDESAGSSEESAEDELLDQAGGCEPAGQGG